MTYQYISTQVHKLLKKYPGFSVKQILDAKDILVLYRPMGNEKHSIKGFYLYNCRIHTIMVNSDLPEKLQTIILAHELGHVMLHKGSGVKCFHEVTPFDESSVMEKDANLFAAELLLRDEDVLQALNSDCTFFDATAKLNVPPEMLDFKFRIMKWRGYKMMEAPITAESKFLKDLKVPEDPSWEGT